MWTKEKGRREAKARIDLLALHQKQLEIDPVVAGKSDAGGVLGPLTKSRTCYKFRWDRQ